jgi:uncharacterized protein
MSDNPRYIMRNCALWIDRNSQIGQASEVQLPDLKIKSESLRNAGMIRGTKINLGREEMTTKIKSTALDPVVLGLFGLVIGQKTPLLVTGALVDEDGTVHSAVATLEGKLFEAKIDAWKPGDKKNENEWTFETDYFKLEIDDRLVLEETLWETGAIKRALLLGV